jgi:hypothetical protein
MNDPLSSTLLWIWRISIKIILIQDVPYLIQHLPSSYSTSDAGNGIGYTGIRIRGLDPTQINVLINGVALNDAESQSVYWVDLPDLYHPLLISRCKDEWVYQDAAASGFSDHSILINTNRWDILKTIFTIGIISWILQYTEIKFIILATGTLTSKMEFPG